ncbi:hypothetical protein B0H11DRAFT_2284397 [Mycena galericulata]|nr:hypothetical protein B0H11DRAFT_2284397 [Mycena galericulata]
MADRDREQDASLGTKQSDDAHVKRPENAFILFRRKCLEDSLSSGSNPGSHSEDVKAAKEDKTSVSQQWKALSMEERAYWEALAKEKKREHEILHPNYVYRPRRSEKSPVHTRSLPPLRLVSMAKSGTDDGGPTSDDLFSSLHEEATAASANEPEISTFILFMPEELDGSNDRAAVRPQDVHFLENSVTNGGNSSSVHRPGEAENWVEDHYDAALLESIRSLGVGGPIATMLSPEIPALAIFGSILDRPVLELAQTLSDASKFPVMVRPIEDDPVPMFIHQQRETVSGTEHGMEDSGGGMGDSDYEMEEDDSATSELEGTSAESGDDEDFPAPEEGVFRLRGGATRQDRNIQIADDANYIVPAGIERPDGSHRTNLHLHLHLHDNSVYTVVVTSKTVFKFQTEKAEIPHALEEPITRPQVLSCVDLKVETTPLQVKLDRSYSHLGFVVHSRDSIAGREYLPRGFEPPVTKATYGTQKSTQNTGSVAVGLASGKPTLSATAARSRTTGETVQLADDKPVPPCYVKEQIGAQWYSDDKSYSSYDIAWHPTVDSKGSPHLLSIRFGMGIEFFGKEERYINNLPSISHILRNLIMLWIFDPKLKAKVRGMVVLMTTYIPDIKILEPLSILEKINVEPACDRFQDPPGVDDATVGNNAANSVAIGFFDKRIETVESGIQKLMNRIKPKSFRQSTKKPVSIDLPMQEYVARGWDVTNQQWRNVLWPALDGGFSDMPRSPTAWNLTLNPGIQKDGTIPQGVPAVRGSEENTTGGGVHLEPEYEPMLVDAPSVPLASSATDSV